MSETVEETTRRRRWLNLAELVGVAGVLIAGLGLYLTWSDKREAAATQARTRLDFVPRGVVASGNRTVLLLRDETHALGDVTVTFPTALGVSPKDAVGHSIESEWFAKPLLKITDGGADDRTGRLPVLVTYRYTTVDDTLTRSAIYDVIWTTSGRFLQGRSLAITDFRLRERGGSPARLNAIWKVPGR